MRSTVAARRRASVVLRRAYVTAFGFGDAVRRHSLCRMMYGDHMDAGGWTLSIVLTLLVVALIVALIVWLIRSQSAGVAPRPDGSGESARDVLDRRLVSGEVKEEESSTSPSEPRSGPSRRVGPPRLRPMPRPARRAAVYLGEHVGYVRHWPITTPLSGFGVRRHGTSSSSSGRPSASA